MVGFNLTHNTLQVIWETIFTAIDWCKTPSYQPMTLLKLTNQI